MVYQAAHAVKIPVIGLGGISCWQDAAEMLIAGAKAVQIGSILFSNPYAPLNIIDGLTNYPDCLVSEFDGDGTKGLPYGLIDDAS